MVSVDLYMGTGFALELLSLSPYHRRYSLGDYFRVEVLPALETGQVRFYMTNAGIPTAMVTWAWLSEAVECDVHTTGRALKHDEWTCGDRLFINDWITPCGNGREVRHDIRHNLFPNDVATSIRRNPDGSVRRVNRWTGINFSKKAREIAS